MSRQKMEIFQNLRKPIQFLKAQTEEVVSNGLLRPIELENDKDINAIAAHFNTLVGQLQEKQEKLQQFHELEERCDGMEKQVLEYKSSLDYLSVISELGQKITSNLSLEEITMNLHKCLDSIMDAALVEIGIYDVDEKCLTYRSITKENFTNGTQILDGKNIAAEWSFSNNKEIFLTDAENDFARYLDKPVEHSDGRMAQSVMCFPIKLENRPSGVLCIISFRKNAFSSYHKEVIKSLSSYAAVALENARIYNELKQAQIQLVQSEKMASLGQLTAGIAHEINNPINFVSGGIDSLKQNYKDLLDVLNLYSALSAEKDNKENLESIEKLKKSISFNSILQEMDDLFNSIKNGASRTTEIVRGLRNFTRLDEDSLKKANIEEGIESTLVILRSHLGNIKLLKQYGEVPDINCFPGQLNQVFMNIISNAIQALNDEGEILIKTVHANKKIQVIIKDSGSGMDQEVRSRIFEPFFTTKEVGKGTGLGLSISYGIIQRHKGNIEVQSEPGKGTTFIITLPDDLKVTDIESQLA